MKIAIAGYGVEGKANYDYWARDDKNDITIFDESSAVAETLPEGMKSDCGPGAFERMQGFDLVIRTAGLAPYKINTDGRIWSATNEFFKKCPAPIIGVTGSKGKGTTASIIASILKAAERTVWLVGNIGLAGLEVIDNIRPGDIVVYELSSFQLWDSVKSPSTAVVLFIEQEHLDVHKDMADYVSAKANIGRFQKSDDLMVFYQHNEYSTSIAEQSPAVKVSFPDRHTAHILEGNFYYGEQKLYSVNHLPLKGEHNQINALAAIDAVWQYVQDADTIARGLAAFHGLPHRLAHVKTLNGVAYYDDSIATTPASAIAALRSFEGAKVIILGGSSKGSDFSGLAKELLQHDVDAILIGAEAETIADACDTAGFHRYETITDTPVMPAVARRAQELADDGDVVLLSPAAASFGLFKNYADRGDQFIDAVQHLS